MGMPCLQNWGSRSSSCGGLIKTPLLTGHSIRPTQHPLSLLEKEALNLPQGTASPALSAGLGAQGRDTAPCPGPGQFAYCNHWATVIGSAMGV